ncbi:MAG: hypothetical protein HYY06_19935 [Deltaproteobacteria bacterium]|nr:hypothetical protein [Deltaproteobacteria bacterium]
MKVALLASVVLLPVAAGAAEPHRSTALLPFGNGHGVAVFDAEARAATQLWEHVYRRYEAEVETRDVLWDSYFGIRAGGGSGVWLTDVEAEIRYLDGDPIVVASQSVGTLDLETYAFSPWGLEGPGLALLLRAVATERTPEAGVDTTIYGLQNLHLGQGRPDPSAEAEEIVWDEAASSYVERGAAGSAVYLPLVAPTRHACSPNNPFVAGGAGEDLVDTDGSGVTDDAVAGFQWDLGLLRPGDAAWTGFLVGFDAGGDASGLLARMQDVVGGRDPRGLLTVERAGWEAFLGSVPADLDDEALVGRLSLAILRMAQNREAGAGQGQIVASLPPGQWNISWVRDMAYAIVALVRAKRANEARGALDFVLDADVGDYAQIVGEPYAVSVTRYFGNGREESDENADGPNIELDGFGLFLWAARRHVDEAGDDEWLGERWEPIRDLVADVLVRRIDDTGLVQADSSIWEVHWNGRQRHFAYTSIAAARGLCDAAALAERVGDGDARARFEGAARGLGRAIVEKLVAPDGSLGASLEDVEAGAGFRDAAVLDAIGWEVIPPRGELARRTLEAMNDLEVPGGTGYFRNDDGGEYDLAEWVFVDLRAALAFEKSGIGPVADGLRDWVGAQGGQNWGLLSELYDRETGDYAGAIPMVGFGGGAWLLADDAFAEDTSCFDVPDEPEPDAGGPDAGVTDDGDENASCACRSAGIGGRGGGLGAWLAVLLLAMAVCAARLRAARAARRSTLPDQQATGDRQQATGNRQPAPGSRASDGRRPRSQRSS